MDKEVSTDELYGFVSNLFSESQDVGSMTIRQVSDELKKSYGLDSVDHELKSRIRTVVDKVFSSMMEEEASKSEGEENPLKKRKKETNHHKSNQTLTKKRKRGENGSSRDSSGTDGRVKTKRKMKENGHRSKLYEDQSKKKPEIESSEESDDSSFLEEEELKRQRLKKENRYKLTRKRAEHKQQRDIQNKHDRDTGISDYEKEKSLNGSKEASSMQIRDTGSENSACDQNDNASSDEDPDENLLSFKTKLEKNKHSIDKNKSVRPNKSEKVDIKSPSPAEDSNDTDKETQPKDRRLKTAEKMNDVSSSDSCEDSMHEEVSGEEHDGKDSDEERRNGDNGREKKKLKKSSEKGERKARTFKDREDSSKLKNLKRYLRSCGMHQNFVKFFEDCRSMAARERKLESYIKDQTGIEGRITLEKCKKYKTKKEDADELAELDVNQIIGSPEKGKRLTRQSTSTVPKRNYASSPVQEPAFKNLLDFVDSEESCEESEKNSRKPKKVVLLASDDESVGNSLEESDTEESRKSKKILSSESDEEGESGVNNKGNGNQRD